ncbi:MAG: hypothetical protein ACRCYU_02465 [Nocardioides sp.]
MNEQSRVPVGLSTGGRWTTDVRQEADVSIAASPSQTALLDRMFGDAVRHQQLLDGGYVPPAFFAAADDPRSAELRAAWWNQHALAADHTPGAPPQMRADGAHRMAYTDDGVTVRMPSVAAIKRYADETGGTFDIPISAVDENGRALTGWVRATRAGAGSWSVERLGFGGVAEARISELVASRLESRRPSRPPREVGNLIERNRARRGVEPQYVTSTWISAVAYDTDTGIMAMRTTSGRSYGHHVSAEAFMKVRNSSSPGAAYNKLVKGNRRAAIASCPTCRRFYSTERSHTCPSGAAPARPDARRANDDNLQAAIDLAAGAQRLRG